MTGDEPRKKKQDRNKNGSPAGSNNLNVSVMLNVFRQSLARIQDYLVPILGESTVDAILRNALRENRPKYEFLDSAIISTSETSFPAMESGENPVDLGDLLRCILDFMQSIIALLTELTGDVLTSKLETMMSDMENHFGEGE